MWGSNGRLAQEAVRRARPGRIRLVAEPYSVRAALRPHRAARKLQAAARGLHVRAAARVEARKRLLLAWLMLALEVTTHEELQQRAAQKVVVVVVVVI